MALKNNTRTVRISDELLDIINQQVGDNFTVKFERLVYNCYMLLPQRERELAELEERIIAKRNELTELARKKHVCSMRLYDLSGLLDKAEKVADDMDLLSL